MSSGCGGLPIWVYMSEVRGQPRTARRGAAIVLLALLAPQGTLLVLRTEPSLDLLVRSATVHLVVVSAISACALAVAMATAVAAGRSRDGSLVLLALGCLAVGFLMLGHGGHPWHRGTATEPVGRAAVHWWRWRLGFDRVQLALVVACLLGAGALVSLQVGALWRLSWWDYHAFLLTGFAAAIYAVLTGYRRSRTLEEGLDGVFAADPMAHISRGYSETLRALIGAVEARDAYTHGHSARVAELSVHLGQRLGLRPAALRSLAEGAYLHDVGKVGIPDHVLNKPGALTEEERAWIQQHPVVGSDIVGRAPSLRDALAVIRQHHERFDGRGYPDGLAGEQISLAARIVAVVDVWDALTSDRAYRAAWPPDRALRHLEAGRGSHFDPVCLDSFLALTAERGHRPGPGGGDAAVASAAAEACHTTT